MTNTKTHNLPLPLSCSTLSTLSIQAPLHAVQQHKKDGG